MNIKRGFIVIIIALFLINLVSAHEENLDQELKERSLRYVYFGAIFMAIITVIALFFANKYKILLFLLLVIPIVLVSSYLVYTTVSLNLKSEYKGPVHWHADFEIWNCDERIDLKDPEGMTNRIGTSVFHEHGDNRIHVEGVVLDKNDVNLHEFFETFGSELTREMLRVETNDEEVFMKNGDNCKGKEGKLQAFLYKIANPEDKTWRYEQVKLEDFESYVLAPYSHVPPGDCIIIEFSEEKAFTEKLCGTYKTALKEGDLIGG